ncbi:hypothetical protein KFL_001160290 [Klebsormidium nitens]|uniref:Uncharacterized protein n=1 Tax=Klebsormidium nitens TaxID=105231 RepID=A0A1Y1HVF1_KLENI|nr:hypothetical protein KFL_001160290 [Klebsormidium nitens]|eukprot:GAQ82595.1 hypothetical protein KFL_001160290 [Klebsormidium nitens]
MDKNAKRRRSEPGSWREQSQGLRGLLGTTGASPKKDKDRAIIRRKSAIGDVKLIDPKASRKDLPPIGTARDHGDLFEQGSSNATPREKQRLASRAGGTDSKASFDHPSVPHVYGAIKLDASPSFATSSLPADKLSISFVLHDSDVLQKVGHAAEESKNEPLPLSTGLDYFVETEKKTRFSNEAELESDSLGDRETTRIRVGFELRRGYEQLPRSEEVTVTYAEAARQATKECCTLIGAVYNWVVISLL